MFNLEMVCSDGIFQFCDDIVSEKMTKEEVKKCVIDLCRRFREEKVYATTEEISFNLYRLGLDNESKENILFNLELFRETCYEVSKEIFNVYNKINNSPCPDYWLTLMNMTTPLFQFEYSTRHI